MSMNEIIFILHIFFLITFISVAAKIGKNALIGISVIQSIISNLFITKQITLFTLCVTTTDAYAISYIVTSNLIQEYFGKNESKKILNINVLLLFFFCIASIIQLSYVPSTHDTYQSAFSKILMPSSRILISSIVSFYTSQRIDIELFAVLRKKFSLKITAILSMITSQAIDTIMFSYLALFGIVNSVANIIIVSYSIKIIAIFSLVPLTRLLRKRISN